MPKASALIIDDKVSNVNVLVHLLKKEGVNCTAISSPKQLSSVVNELEHIEVVFLDLEMPERDGFSLLHELKANELFQGVPIIAYTVHVSEINEARLAGFDGFLGKPLKASHFPQQLKSILNGEPVWVY